MSGLLGAFKRGRPDKFLHIVAAVDGEDLAGKMAALCCAHTEAAAVPDDEAATIPDRLHCGVCRAQLRHVKERFP